MQEAMTDTLRRIVLLSIGLAGLPVSGLVAQECRLPQKPMVEVEMMFGRNIGGKFGVTDRRWARFLASEVMPRFPNGLTVLDAAGQWREPARKRLIREPSKIVIILAAREEASQAKIDAIVTEYKRRFRQDSVGVVMRPACVSF